MLRHVRGKFGVKSVHDFPKNSSLWVKSKTQNKFYQHSTFQKCILLLTLLWHLKSYSTKHCQSAWANWWGLYSLKTVTRREYWVKKQHLNWSDVSLAIGKLSQTGMSALETSNNYIPESWWIYFTIFELNILQITHLIFVQISNWIFLMQ